MKYYVYISPVKVNMLFDQLPRTLLSRFAAELKIDLQFASTTISEARGARELSLYQRLDLVLKHLDTDDRIGTIGGSELFFRGEMNAIMGEFPDTGLFYLTGEVDGSIVGLGGSMHHALGAGATPELSRPVRSALAGIQQSLVEELGFEPCAQVLHEGEANGSKKGESGSSSDLVFGLSEAHQRLRGASSKVEFVAIRLFENQEKPPKIILGSPLYVARGR